MLGGFFRGCFGAFFPLCLCLVFTGNALAPPSAPSADKVLCNVDAERFVNQRLGIWQERLGLKDWKISTRMSRRDDLKPHTRGNIRWDSAGNSAVVRVLQASEYRMGCREMLDDMELTLVHELVHLELSSLPRSDESRRDEEQAVNRITAALLKSVR